MSLLSNFVFLSCVFFWLLFICTVLLKIQEIELSLYVLMYCVCVSVLESGGERETEAERQTDMVNHLTSVPTKFLAKHPENAFV